MSLIDYEYLNKTFNFVNEFEIIEGTDSHYYNCISHSIGINDKWSWCKIVDNNNYWPISNKNENIEAFDEFYKHHGYDPISINNIYIGENKIALYSIGNKPKHASLQIKNNIYESKMGRGELLRHDPFDIENSIYGNIIRLYEKH